MRPDDVRASRLRARARALLPVLLFALLLAPALGAARFGDSDDRCDPPLYRAVVQLGASQADLPAAPVAPAPPERAGALAREGTVPAESAAGLPDHRPRGPPARRTA
jgi:hypothetical protein